MANSPRHGIPLMSSATEQQWSTFSQAMKYFDALTDTVILGSQTTPPGSPDEGDTYIVTATATGAWTGHEDELAYYINSAWMFFTAAEGKIVWDSANSLYLRWTGSVWAQTLNVVPMSIWYPGTPGNSELMFEVVFSEPYLFPADIVGSEGHIRSLPTATTTLDMLKNDTPFGDITITTGGVFTFDTSATPISFAASDYFTIQNQSTADATAAQIALSLRGLK